MAESEMPKSVPELDVLLRDARKPEEIPEICRKFWTERGVAHADPTYRGLLGQLVSDRFAVHGCGISV